MRHIGIVVATAGAAALLAWPVTSSANPGHAPTREGSAPRPIADVVVSITSFGPVVEPSAAATSGAEPRPPDSMSVATARVSFYPGATVGWQRHPGSAVVTVTRGSVTVVDRHCGRHVHPVGQTFVETGRDLIVNDGSIVAETVVTYFVPADADRLSIPADAPSSCRT